VSREKVSIEEALRDGLAKAAKEGPPIKNPRVEFEDGIAYMFDGDRPIMMMNEAQFREMAKSE